MAIIFDGKMFALQKKEELKKKVLDLNTKGKFPHLASIVIGDNPASKLYVSLKKKAGEAIGIQVDIYYIPEYTKKEDVITLIKTLNVDSEFSGIMVQLPIPGSLSKFKDEIINTIDLSKDVDGLRENSLFLHPTSKAVIDVIDESKNTIDYGTNPIVCVVGATGMVGRPLVKELKKEGYQVIECDHDTRDLGEKTLKADILISVTGKPALITKDMVKVGATVIDVGSPKGDISLGVYEVAGFITPVPGGIGPITIASLLENLVKASEAIV